MTRAMKHRPIQHEVLGKEHWRVLVFRWLLGQHHRGYKLTNATWLHDGDTPLDRTKVKIHKRHFRAGWKRCGVRLGGIIAALTFIVLLAGWREQLFDLLRVLFVVVLVLGAVAGHHAMKDKQRKKTYDRRIAEWYANQFGVPVHDALQRVDIPEGHRDNPDLVSSVQLPAHYTPNSAQEAALSSAISNMLGLTDPDHTIEHIGIPRLLISAAPAPPPRVTFADMLPYLDTPDDETLFIGLGRRGAPVYLSWKLDSPHALLSFESGMGKSNFAAGLALQTIRKGGCVDVFDFAKHGASVADWCRDENGVLLPGFRVYLTVEDAHEGLIRLAEERAERSKAIWDRTAKRSDFQRRLVIMEESNISIPLLTNYWRKIKETGDPYVSPALEAYRSIPGAGRDVKYNLLAICQKGSSRAAGGEEIRENTGIKCFGNSSVRTLKNLVEHIKPLPTMYSTPGRISLCVGQTATDVQVGQWIDSNDPTIAAQGRAWAIAGRPAQSQGQTAVTPDSSPVENDPPCSPVFTAPDTAADTGQDSGPVPDERLPEPDSADLVSIVEALELGIITGTKNAVNLVRSKTPDRFPEKKGEGKRGTFLYAREDLMAWELLKGLSGGSSVRDDKQDGGQ